MAESANAASESAPVESQARHVVYCGDTNSRVITVCTLPPEYCEFGGTVKKCEEWLKTNHPDMHARIYSEEALATTLSTLSLDAQKRAEKDSLKKQAKAEAAEAREHEKKMSAKILIKRVERSKRKYVTAVSGLEAHGLELKKVAKELGKKFATGSSVTKVPSGGEEIVVQGDLSDEIYDWITGTYGDIPEDNIDCIEDKKKKGAGAGGPA
ncbi:MAG: Translation machinery-associated protein 22 [Trichoglossum hirsutum]|nr:MAG: Translation machinery-associated protein 22 [Trichoglossum hirsutum]